MEMTTLFNSRYTPDLRGFIEFLEALPTTPSGKLAKHSLRENNREGTPTWDREAAGYVLERR